MRLYPALLILSALMPLGAREPDIIQSPRALSLFPMGGSAGSRFQGQIRGTGLDGAYAIWFDAAGLSGKIKNVQEIAIEPVRRSGTNDKEAPRGQSIQVDVEIESAVAPGVYSLRVLSPKGISNPLPFPVSTEPVVAETLNPHSTPEQAQELRWPTILNGRIGKPGELDFYAFQVPEGEELSFEVFSRPVGDAPANKLIQSGFDPQLFLYELGGSWFDPDRLISLAYNDDPVFASIDANARITYKFKKPGRYLLEVRAYPGNAGGESSLPPPGGPDFCYQLLIGPSGRRPLSDAAREKWEALLGRSSWREQTFERRIGVNRLLELGSRSQAIVDEPEVKVVQGAIAQPGAAESHKFQVKAGDRLAFEIETTGMGLPYFNPLLKVLDSEGREVFTNVYLRIGRNPHYRKTVQPKVLWTFATGGEFTAQVRDITSRRGDPAFRYKLLIRRQVPHVGEIEITEHFVNTDGNGTQADYPVDRINIATGTAKKLSVRTGLEEDFAASVIVRVEGLPTGVELLPASDTELVDTPRLDQGEKLRFLPKTTTATLMLTARTDSAGTLAPHFVRVIVTPVHPDGSLGAPLSTQRIPLMVTGRNAEISSRGGTGR